MTDPDAAPHQRMSMLLVPRETPGIVTVRPTRFMGEPEDAIDHALIRYDDVRVPAENMLGGPGQGFEVAQTRLSGGRIHHAMRAVGQARHAFEMACERVLSRTTRGRSLADQQLVQQAITDSYAQIEQFRLFVLRTAWRIDQGQGYTHEIRRDIAVAKVLSGGSCTTSSSGRCTCMERWASPTRCRSAPVGAGGRLRHLGRPHGGPHLHRGAPGPPRPPARAR